VNVVGLMIQASSSKDDIVRWLCGVMPGDKKSTEELGIIMRIFNVANQKCKANSEALVVHIGRTLLTCVLRLTRENFLLNRGAIEYNHLVEATIVTVFLPLALDRKNHYENSDLNQINLPQMYNNLN